MAKYRPKSLDELNSFYDKSLSTQNAIKSSASAISSEAFSDEQADSSKEIDDFFAEQADISTGNCKDLTEDIQKFIRDFGKPATAEDEIAIRRRPVPIKLRHIPEPPKPSHEAVSTAQNSEDVQSTQPAAEDSTPREIKPEKTEFVITAEKNELFEEYMRIMSDEDDDAEYSKSRSRKRKKNKKGADAPESVPEESTAIPTPTVIPDIDTYEDDESFVSFAAEDDREAEKSDERKPLSLTEDSDSPFVSEEHEEEEEEENQPRKKTGLQLFLFLLLFVTLMSALAVTAVKTVVKVNSGELFMNKYYVYTAEFTDRVTDINEGDLLLVENVPAENNEVFAYTTPDGIAYAVQTFSGEPERTSGKSSTNDSITVLNTSIKGKVTRIYPSLGKAAAVITESFLTVIAFLLVIAVLIILLLIFAFRHTPSNGKISAKDNFSFDEEEDFDETSGDDFTFTRNK